MTIAVVLAWAAVGALLGHLLDRLVRHAARREDESAAHAPAVPVAAGTSTVWIPAGTSAGAPAVWTPADAPGGADASGVLGAPAGSSGSDDRDTRVGAPGDPTAPGRVPLDRHLGRPWGSAVVPVLAALGALLTGWRFGLDPAGLPFLVFVPLLAELAVVDLHTRRLPNVLTLPALPVGLVLIAAAAGAQGRPGVLAGAVGAAVLLFVVLLLLALLRPAGMGLGDVKAAAAIGLYVGSISVGAALAALVLAAVGAFAGGLVLMAAGRIGRRTATPFGPWLAAGALAAVLAGPELVRGYLALIG